MAVPVAAPQLSPVQRVVTFYHDVMAEMRKVTWPDMPQVRQLSIGVISLSLLIGGVIWLMDLLLQSVLVRWIPALFGG
ncbi:MAG: preprotein translocase subunit SecE [Gemmatimonadetes bacterium]|nr:preprotein translocase subunit SecE [Gemmatimonadota bacterium]